MTTWCVYHLVHIKNPPWYLPILLVTEVPEDAELTIDALERAGYHFREFNTTWGYHVLAEVVETLPADLLTNIREMDVWHVAYSDLGGDNDQGQH